MACARCGCGVYQSQDIITLNKMWHKCCFTCYRCKKKLDKCTAKIFQGEVFCDCCYNCLLEELDLLSKPSKPCRVVSSPSCTCGKDHSKPTRVLPPFDDHRKCLACLHAGQKARIAKTSLSCSCIPDIKPSPGKKIYCFAFPMPREMANYYNRTHTMSKQSKPNCSCCRSKKPENPPICLKLRSFSQQRPCPKCRQTSCRSASSPRPSPPTCQRPSRNHSPPPGCCCSPQNQRCRPPSPPPQCCPPRALPSQPEKCWCPKCCPPPRCSSQHQQCRQSSPPPQCCSSHTPPSQSEKCCCPKCCPPPRCKAHSCPPRPSCPKRSRSQTRIRKLCSPCYPEGNRKQSEIDRKPPCQCCPVVREENFDSCLFKLPKYCPCGNLNPCNCKMCQVRAVCTPSCIRCGYKVYAAEKISVTKGAYHTNCFSCFCCHKLLDVKNVYENCGEIYCKRCYNNLFGNQFYGYGSSQFC